MYVESSSHTMHFTKIVQCQRKLNLVKTTVEVGAVKLNLFPYLNKKEEKNGSQIAKKL